MEVGARVVLLSSKNKPSGLCTDQHFPFRNKTLSSIAGVIPSQLVLPRLEIPSRSSCPSFFGCAGDSGRGLCAIPLHKFQQ